MGRQCYRCKKPGLYDRLVGDNLECFECEECLECGATWWNDPPKLARDAKGPFVTDATKRFLKRGGK